MEGFIWENFYVAGIILLKSRPGKNTVGWISKCRPRKIRSTLLVIWRFLLHFYPISGMSTNVPVSKRKMAGPWWFCAFPTGMRETIYPISPFLWELSWKPIILWRSVTMQRICCPVLSGICSVRNCRSMGVGICCSDCFCLPPCGISNIWNRSITKAGPLKKNWKDRFRMPNCNGCWKSKNHWCFLLPLWEEMTTCWWNWRI